MHPALAIILIIVLITVWFAYGAFRLKYRNQARRGRYKSFQPRWSSGRRHRHVRRFKRTSL